MNRRGLLQGMAAAGVSAATGVGRSRSGAAAPYGKPVGIQLYTVRDQLAKDVRGTLEQVAAVGYQEVELTEWEVFHFSGKTPKEMARILKDCGLRAPSCHYATPKLGDGWKRYIEHAHELGLTYMVNAMGPDKARSLDDFKRYADIYLKAAEETQKAGIRFCYHNHNFEFRKYGDTTAYDFLLKTLEPRLVSFELDCFWMTHAGHDPVTTFKRHPGRFPLLHIKDVKVGTVPATTLDDRPGIFAEVGQGTIDWKRIFAAAPGGGMKHYYVEQDFCERPVAESIKMSYQFLRGLHV